ncbi:MAG: cytochrome c class I [Chitinophaga sp.]|nr:cytochrome c class I [Chitinophaga sp.]
MKKIFILFAAVAMYACGSNSTETKKEEAAKPVVADNSANPDYQKGLELVAKSDCLTCHKIDEKVTGPSYRDVANKYSEKDIPMLASKIIKGGTGVWGNLLMTPHPAVSQADAEQMVKYILLLKK